MGPDPDPGPNSDSGPSSDPDPDLDSEADPDVIADPDSDTDPDVVVDPDSDTGLSKDQNSLVRKGYVPFFDDRYPECYSMQEYKSKKQSNPYSAKSMARQGKILRILDGDEFAKIVINEKKVYQNNAETNQNRKSSNLRKLQKQRAKTAPTSF